MNQLYANQKGYQPKVFGSRIKISAPFAPDRNPISFSYRGLQKRGRQFQDLVSLGDTGVKYAILYSSICVALQVIPDGQCILVRGPSISPAQRGRVHDGISQSCPR